MAVPPVKHSNFLQYQYTGNDVFDRHFVKKDDAAVPDRPKGFSFRCHRDLIVCAQALPAPMNAGLFCGMQRPGAGICSGPMSGSMMLNAGSVPSRSGGGARTATRLSMTCGENNPDENLTVDRVDPGLVPDMIFLRSTALQLSSEIKIFNKRAPAGSSKTRLTNASKK
jgi:hypothetical protein